VLHPPPVDHQEALTEYPWDNFVEDENNPSGAPNNQAGIYSEFANNTALKFGGICFTTE
jgi:hypothetical protein